MHISVDANKCDGCGADVFRFTNKKDKVFAFGNKYYVNCRVEGWVEWHMLGLLQQLGGKLVVE